MSINGERAMDLLRRISFERLGGTAEEDKAADILISDLATFGISAAKEKFPVTNYRIDQARLTVTKPYSQEYSVTGYGRTGSTDEDGLCAELIYAGDGGEVDLHQSAGKAVILNSRVSLEIYERLCKEKVAAFVSISGNVFDNPQDTDLHHFSIREGHLKHGQIPGVVLRAKDALELLERGASEIRLELFQEDLPVQSCNVVCEITGSLFPEEIIVYTAHFDSVHYSSGANDNGAGSVILMELCRYFAEHQPQRTLRFVWCGSEEYGLLGSFFHVAEHQEDLDKVKLVINVDVAGGFIGRNSTIVTGPQALVDVIDYLCKEHGIAMQLRHDVYSSDSVPFAEMGIPGVNFCRFGAPIHNRFDQLQYISADRLAELGEIVRIFSERTINAAVFPVKRELPDNIKKSMVKYLQNSRGEKMEIPVALK
ncbi:MAG: M28 family metallopeptidase [Symbiobacteriaceae bacterium]|nr:M28 family metallopeptidase [Symbiobacteriaceae bacterium]